MAVVVGAVGAVLGAVVIVVLVVVAVLAGQRRRACHCHCHCHYCCCYMGDFEELFLPEAVAAAAVLL